MSITTPMSCSIRTIVVHVLLVDVEDGAAHVLFSSTFMPASARRSSVEPPRARELDALHISRGRAGTGVLPDVLDLQESMISSTFAQFSGSLRRARGRRWSACSRIVAFILRVAAGHDVVQHAHALNRAMFWNVRAMPWRAASCRTICRRGLPPDVICRPPGVVTPLVTLSVELFPAPLGLMIARGSH